MTDPALADLPEPLEDEAQYTGFALADASFDEERASDVSFRQLRLLRCNLGRTTLHRAEFIDIRFDSCSLAGGDWEKTTMNRVVLEDCGLVGLRLIDAVLDDLVVRGSNCEMALFWSARFRRGRFERCNLRRASFEGADLSGVTFSGCDLTGADFRGATLSGTDFRGSRIEGISVHAGDVRGAIVSPDQAADLVGLLGVTVRWEGEDPSEG